MNLPTETQAIFITACSGEKQPGGDGQPFSRLGPHDYIFRSLHAERAGLVRFYSELPKERAGAFYKSGRDSVKVARAWDTNQALSDKPTMPAARRYCGQLYSALGWPVDQPPEARGALLIVSSMFGLIGPQDPIPEYELISTDQAPSGRSVKLLWRDALGGSGFQNEFIATFPRIRYVYLLLSDRYREAVEALTRGYESYAVNVPGGSTGVSPRRWGRVARHALSQGAFLPEHVRKIAEGVGCSLQRLP